jgi:hypothetical protein
MSTLINQKEGKYHILIEENTPSKGKKTTFEAILNPLGKANGSLYCVAAGCTSKMGNKQGICTKGKHSKSLDLLLSIQDNKGKALAVPSFTECVQAVRYYEKENDEDDFLELVKFVAKTYIGRIPPYYVYNKDIKGYYDAAGTLIKLPTVKKNAFTDAFSQVKDKLISEFVDGSNSTLESFEINRKSGIKINYSFRVYMLTFLWLILVEEINRGDRWTSKTFFGTTRHSRNSGGAMPIILYWTYRFNWGSDITNGNARIPITVNY